VIKMKVPRVDPNGNELGGVPTRAPRRATWHVPGLEHHGRAVSMPASVQLRRRQVPFAQTKAQRQAAGDPRLFARGTLQQLARWLRRGGIRRPPTMRNNKGYLLAADRDALIAQSGCKRRPAQGRRWREVQSGGAVRGKKR